jgi:hypothetical protein
LDTCLLSSNQPDTGMARKLDMGRWLPICIRPL